MGNQQSLQGKEYQQIYTTTYQIYLMQNKEDKCPDPKLFSDLFDIFSTKQKKNYKWSTAICDYVGEYFYDILPSVRKAQIQSFYKAVNVTMFQNHGDDDSYEDSFYDCLNPDKIKKQKKQVRSTSLLLRQSLLFQDEVVDIYNDEPRNSNKMFRSSVIHPQLRETKQQTNGVVIRQAIFIENLPKKAQQELSFFIEFYNRFTMVIESLMNSASFVSLPLRHFEQYMKQKKQKKRIRIIKGDQIKIDSKILKENEKGQQRRKVQAHNQKLLLQQIAAFTLSYTDFVWGFYNLQKINQTSYSKLVNYENIYNLMTNVVWTRVEWVGERGWQYEQTLTQLYLIKKCGRNQRIFIPEKILDLVLNLPTIPIKHLKQVVLIYRQMVKLSKEITADDLMLAYNSMFYEMAKRNRLKRVFRFVQIVNILWKGEKFGEIGYAWITWQASLEMILKQAKKHTLKLLFSQNSINQ